MASVIPREGRSVMAQAEPQDRDVQRLAELGYRQELARAWSGFSNFALSFTIISVLAGCFTVYGQAWNNGGPIGIVASVDYAAATFAATLFNLWGLNLGVIDFKDGAGLGDIFVVFVVVLILTGLVNVYRSHLVALINNISVGWHVLGVAALIATVGQLFCGLGCLTSASRTWYAFARDRAIPGWQVWSRVRQEARAPELG